jgi:putative permease
MAEIVKAAGFGRELFASLVRVLLLATGIVLLIWFLHRIQRVLLVFTVALIIALAINVPVTALENRGWRRGWALLLVVVGLLVGTAGIAWLVVPRLMDELPTLVAAVPQMAENLAGRISSIAGDSAEVDHQLSRIADWVTDALRNSWQYLDALIAAFLLGLFVVAMVLYMVANPRPLVETYLRVMPEHLRAPAARAFARGSTMVVGWVYSNLILGGMKAAASFAFLTFMDIPGALIWSVLALLSALVERLGFYIMSIPPVIVAFAVEPVTAVWVLLFYWALSEFLGNFVAPKVRQATMKLNAVYILFMTLAMAYAFGILGVLVASPVAGFLKVYFDEFYLPRRPVDAHMEHRVEAILNRRVTDLRF